MAGREYVNINGINPSNIGTHHEYLNTSHPDRRIRAFTA